MPLHRICCFSLILAAFTATVAGAQAERSEAKRLLLIGQGPDGHPEGTHEYRQGLRILHDCLVASPGVDVQLVMADGDWLEGPQLIDEADGVVLFLAEGAKWIQQDPRRLEAFARLAERQGGLVTLHWAMGTRDAQYIDNFVRLFGGCHGGPDRKYKVLETKLTVADAKHPITAELQDFTIRDEFYYRLKLTPGPSITPILLALIDGRQETVAWAWQRPGGGRSFGFSGLHFHDNWQRPEYRRLVRHATLWTINVASPAPDELEAASP